ncbi:hypothetical protein GIS00_03430 [Nakamurella sp. YIM 132087]|uniref:Uncharacterized protein n=1 Tax=Nakamurella alba TaxID=2665158 RepID=A0A7K1FFW7_9ACTN|nr:hypothetical protein [Nakamurella alba]MTD12997.1 hypothetical protein [Nakamurella alba]
MPQQPVDPPPVSIPPPTPVRIAGVSVLVQAAAVVVLAVIMVISGLGNDADVGQLLAQGAYFVVLALAMAVCAAGLLRGRRWGRTPVIVLQIIVGAIGFYLAVPSGQLLPGLGLIVLAVATGGLLLTKQANDWISRFPSLFGPEPGR